jgi:hypothetical protein
MSSKKMNRKMDYSADNCIFSAKGNLLKSLWLEW